MVCLFVIGVAFILLFTVLAVLVAGLLSMVLTGGNVAQLVELVRFARTVFKRRR